jgi:hypothetical protein
MQSRSAQLLLAVVVFAAGGCSGGRAEAAPAPRWRRVVLVELYTSQGCSSCPPADAFVRDLPALGFGRDKVIPLTFHVDYWDALGWKDPFARAIFTSRQGWYARSATLRSPEGERGIEGIYTPQMIVDGQVHFSGQRRDDAAREMERAAARPPLFDLTADAKTNGSTVDVTVQVAAREGATHVRDWRLVVALAATRARTTVAHGENAGETLEEAAVVRALSDRVPLPSSGRGPVTVRLTRPADLAWSDLDVVAFVQSETTREIGAVVEPVKARSARPGAAD